LAVVLGLFLAYLAVRAPGFFQGRQLLALATATAPVLVAAVGVSLVIICRQIDISAGSQFALCSVVLGMAAQRGVGVVGLVGVAVGVGALMGAVNGGLVAGVGLPSIVVTLATMVTWREALRWWREGEFVRDLPERFQWFGLEQTSGQWMVVILGLVVLVTGWVYATYFSGGRFIYAVGSDPEAARLAGIRPRRVTFWVFVAMGGMVGLAAFLNAVRFTDVDPKTGTGLEMQAIAAAVVGGVAVAGGRGNLLWVFVGVILLASIGPALVFLKLPPQWERAIQGGIILLAVASDRLVRGRAGVRERRER